MHFKMRGSYWVCLLENMNGVDRGIKKQTNQVIAYQYR